MKVIDVSKLRLPCLSLILISATSLIGLCWHMIYIMTVLDLINKEKIDYARVLERILNKHILSILLCLREQN